MKIIWDHFPRGGSEKLVILALADWCNDKGESLHPSMEAIAVKCCMSRRQAQRAMQTFEREGLLECIGNATGGAPGQTKHYRLRLDKIKAMTGDADVTPSSLPTGDANVTPTGDTHDTGDTGDTGDTQGQRRVTPVTQTGDTHVTQTTIEPSIEPPERAKPSLSGIACRSLRSRGVHGVNPGHPKFLALLNAGVGVEEFESLADELVETNKPKTFAYLLSVAEGRLRDAAQSREIERSEHSSQFEGAR